MTKWITAGGDVLAAIVCIACISTMGWRLKTQALTDDQRRFSKLVIYGATVVMFVCVLLAALRAFQT